MGHSQAATAGARDDLLTTLTHVEEEKQKLQTELIDVSSKQLACRPPPSGTRFAAQCLHTGVPRACSCASDSCHLVAVAGCYLELL